MPVATGVDVEPPPVKSKPVKPPRPSGKFRRCHLCGQLTLINSYKDHYKTCLKLWLEDEAQKPKPEQRPIPPEPPAPGGPGTELSDETPDAELDEFNAQALLIWKEKALERCPKCGRSFHPKALEYHRRGCQAVPDGHAYPTVLEAVRSVRRGRAPVHVSQPGPVRLDKRRVEARRVVRGAWEAVDSFQPAAEPAAKRHSSRPSTARATPRRAAGGLVRRAAPQRTKGRFKDSPTIRSVFAQTAFGLADTDKSGRVSVRSLHAVFAVHPHLSDVLGLPHARNETSSNVVWAEAARREDDTLALALAPLCGDSQARVVQFGAFLRLVTLLPSPSHEAIKSAACKTLFELADYKSPRGRVTEDELSGAFGDRPELLQLLGAKADAQSLSELFNRMDRARGGRVSFLEFEEFVQEVLGDEPSSREDGNAPPPPAVQHATRRAPTDVSSLRARDMAPKRSATETCESATTAAARRASERVRSYRAEESAPRGLTPTEVASVLRRAEARLGESPRRATRKPRAERDDRRVPSAAVEATVPTQRQASRELEDGVVHLLSRLESRLAQLEETHVHVLGVLGNLDSATSTAAPAAQPVETQPALQAEWARHFSSSIGRFA